MLDFHKQRFNVLVCTTIIESGIDIPNANTIIINRADKFGLAQLHQLRGRVGRSHHRAYAYLVVPDNAAITADARKRLEAIAAMDELGAGFTLATHDLEIRGAGELLALKRRIWVTCHVRWWAQISQISNSPALPQRTQWNHLSTPRGDRAYIDAAEAELRNGRLHEVWAKQQPNQALAADGAHVINVKPLRSGRAAAEKHRVSNDKR